MHMVRRYLHLINFYFVTLTNFPEKLLYTFSKISPKNPLSIFRSPHQVVFGVIYRMTGSSRCHTEKLTSTSELVNGRLFRKARWH